MLRLRKVVGGRAPTSRPVVVLRPRGKGGMIGGRLLTLADVAGVLGCSLSTVRRRVREGALPRYADGRLVRVREDDLRRYVAERVCRRSSSTAPTLAPGRTLPKGARLWD